MSGVWVVGEKESYWRRPFKTSISSWKAVFRPRKSSIPAKFRDLWRIRFLDSPLRGHWPRLHSVSCSYSVPCFITRKRKKAGLRNLTVEGTSHNKMSSNFDKLSFDSHIFLQSIKDENSRDERLAAFLVESESRDIKAPEFENDLQWLNCSEALTLEKHLTGKIVVLDFFTYCCINCMHVLPSITVNSGIWKWYDEFSPIFNSTIKQ